MGAGAGPSEAWSVSIWARAPGSNTAGTGAEAAGRLGLVTGTGRGEQGSRESGPEGRGDRQRHVRRCFWAQRQDGGGRRCGRRTAAQGTNEARPVLGQQGVTLQAAQEWAVMGGHPREGGDRRAWRPTEEQKKKGKLVRYKIMKKNM
jgi:hypothetical protein